MNITPDQARELLDGATPGPWEMLHTEWEDEEGTECEMWSVCDESDALMDTGPMWEGHDPEANLNLAAAAPDLAQTIIEQGSQIERLQKALHKADKWGNCLEMLIEDGLIEPEDVETPDD